MEKNASIFRRYLLSEELTFLMEAHNGLSAKIAEATGFKALWASGLTISASLGVRDCNEISWTQVLEVLEYMSDSVSVPIMVDADTGYGNFNSVRRLVRKLCDRGISAVCIEDKIFPKTNSFIDRNQDLANIDEFCGKIKAGKDSQNYSDFTIVARTEALISGHGLKEALTRSEAYRKAGADAILIHSKMSNADEIFSFTREWANRLPLVIVPTKYYNVPTHLYRENKISMIIWANHSLRACITAMKQICKKIYDDESLLAVEKSVASLEEIFSLVNDHELQQAENKYLPQPV